MNDDLDQASKDAVAVLASSLQESIAEAAHAAIAVAMTGTIDDAHETLSRLNDAVKTISRDLEPVLREAVRAEFAGLRGEIPRLVDVGTAKSGAATAELLKEQSAIGTRAIQSIADSVDSHATMDLSQTQELNAAVMKVFERTDELGVQFVSIMADQHRELTRMLLETSAKATADLRSDLATLGNSLAAILALLEKADASLEAERVRVRQVETKYFRALAAAILLTLTAAVFSALGFLLR